MAGNDPSAHRPQPAVLDGDVHGARGLCADCQLQLGRDQDVIDMLTDAFAQDSWKLRPNLTLEYGLRAGYWTNNAELNGLGAYFDESAYNRTSASTWIRARSGSSTATATCQLDARRQVCSATAARLPCRA